MYSEHNLNLTILVVNLSRPNRPDVTNIMYILTLLPTVHLHALYMELMYMDKFPIMSNVEDLLMIY